MSDIHSAPPTAKVPQQRQESVPAPVPDVVREFQLVHDAMRSGMQLLVDAAQRLEAGPSAHARKLGVVSAFFLTFVHHHHTGEDTHWWPSLVARSSAAGEQLAPLTEDHHELDPLLDALRGHAERLKAGTHDPAAVRRDLGELQEHLLQHLAAEEPVLFPLLSRYMEPAEAARLGKVMASSAPRSGLGYLLGCMDDAATELQQQVILSKMPAPIRLVRPLLLRGYRKDKAVLLGS